MTQLANTWSYPKPITEAEFLSYYGTTEHQRMLFVATHPKWNNSGQYWLYRVFIAQLQHGIAIDYGKIPNYYGNGWNIPPKMARAYIKSIGGLDTKTVR